MSGDYRNIIKLKKKKKTMVSPLIKGNTVSNLKVTPIPCSLSILNSSTYQALNIGWL